MTGEHAGLTQWQRAVELGAQGWAAAARTALATLVADPRTSTAVVSLAHSTRASLIRQSGGHAAARAGDGRACALAVAGADSDDEWLSAAWMDGLVGLAADNLGIGDFAASRRLLDRAAGCRADARTALRLSWVRSEWGLYSGDLTVARAAAARSADLAEALDSPRHGLKTGLIAAAVAAATGDTEAAVRGGRAAYDRAGELGLLPLRWAAATLLAGVDPGTGEYAASAAELRSVLARRGMPLAPLRPGERHGR